MTSHVHVTIATTGGSTHLTGAKQVQQISDTAKERAQEREQKSLSKLTRKCVNRLFTFPGCVV